MHHHKTKRTHLSHYQLNVAKHGVYNLNFRNELLVWLITGQVAFYLPLTSPKWLTNEPIITSFMRIRG